MKRIAIALLALWVSGCATLGLEKFNMPQQITQYYEQNTWKISNNRYFGTAFYVTDELLVTNAHVLVERPRGRLGHTDGGPATQFFLSRPGRLPNMPVEIVRMDEELDLALLRCSQCKLAGEMSGYTLNPEPYPLGTRAFGGGNGLGLFSIHTGFIQTTDEGYVYADVNTSPGDSGSPLIVLDDGVVNIVGVRSAVANAFGAPVYHKGRSIRMSVVEEWLSQ